MSTVASTVDAGLDHASKGGNAPPVVGGYGMFAPVGAFLYGGIAKSEADANVMSLNMMIALSKMLQGMANYLAELAKEQIKAQQPIVDKIDQYNSKTKLSTSDSGHVQMLTQELNDLNTAYDQAKQAGSTVRDQLSTAFQQLQQQVANIIQNLVNFTQVIGNIAGKL